MSKFYVIERYVGNVQNYWRPAGLSQRIEMGYGNWTVDVGMAVKFADEESATQVLYSSCKGVGRVVAIETSQAGGKS